MASPSLASILTSSSYCPTLTSPSSSAPTLTSFNVNSRACPKITEHLHQQSQRSSRGLSVKALTLDFSGSFFEGGVEDDEPPGSSISLLDGKEEPQCPPGLRQYETMAVLRPDMSEDERLNLTQKYEEVIQISPSPLISFRSILRYKYCTMNTVTLYLFFFFSNA
uniref:Uncharacterized protein n=1 Tax=Nelumbo nucifera TaxID=4432 RepID=A0A822XGI0_NELNU|nr:TPA_asm: hypothetical protein HUJ06_019398 [Nelumbo nucifera]